MSICFDVSQLKFHRIQHLYREGKTPNNYFFMLLAKLCPDKLLIDNAQHPMQLNNSPSSKFQHLVSSDPQLCV